MIILLSLSLSKPDNIYVQVPRNGHPVPLPLKPKHFMKALSECVLSQLTRRGKVLIQLDVQSEIPCSYSFTLDTYRDY